jgi:hypothetical protein
MTGTFADERPRLVEILRADAGGCRARPTCACLSDRGPVTCSHDDGVLIRRVWALVLGVGA